MSSECALEGVYGHAWRLDTGSMDLRLNEIRTKKGLTQEQLAERAGVDRSFISKLESNQVGWTRATLKVLSEGLGVPEWELVGYSSPPDRHLSPFQRRLVRAVAKLDDATCKLLLAAASEAIRDADAESVALPEPDEDADIDWHAALLTLRDTYRVSSKEIAIRVGVDPSLVSRWFNRGRRPARTTQRDLLEMVEECQLRREA